ncbi:DAK2 domain-containing protein [Micromonospora sp. CPCC 206061]|uniref:DAK2 domain-containing protein n=1 Tax=Micromonospora sp. CPCC 206061 TaxID=3122410 RepID=UPI002FF21955
MLETFDAAAVRHWCAAGLESMRQHQREIDELNVYPVPDGDTGTNLVLTLASAQQAVDLDLTTVAETDDGQTAHGRALRLMARGALLGARGNSGVILSQILRGLADSLGGAAIVRGEAVASALGAAAEAAYAAVSKPVEGTMLTVVAAAATGAAAAGSDDLDAVVRSAAAEAARALARTPEQLPALARAGVVDAGGRGLCVLLDSLVAVVTGEHVETPPVASRPPVTAARETGSSEYAYEVQYLLDAAGPAVERLKEILGGLGDSLVVVGAGGDPPTWNVHVHVNDVGAAIEAGVEAGRPHRISVTRFEDQAVAAQSRPAQAERAPDGRGAVAVAAGAGLAALLRGEGAHVVPANPSTAELLDAVLATGAARVVVLPDDPDTQAVASSAAMEAHALGVRVSVVPTRSPVQAMAALAVRDPGRRFEDDVIAMAEAAGACRYAEVCFASREALTVAGPCRPGDVLALVDDEVHLIGHDLHQTCRDLLDRLLGGGGELVTLLIGADAPAGFGEALRGHVAQRWPFVEVNEYDGGQPLYPLLVGVE